jgi:hypothetical protein
MKKDKLCSIIWVIMKGHCLAKFQPFVTAKCAVTDNEFFQTNKVKEWTDLNDKLCPMYIIFKKNDMIPSLIREPAYHAGDTLLLQLSFFLKFQRK